MCRPGRCRQPWANKNPGDRYPRLGYSLSLFAAGDMEEANGLSPLFVALMAKAPDKVRFLGESHHRIRRSGWSGSLADILGKRKAMLAPLAADPDLGVQAWLQAQGPRLDDWIAGERLRESAREESFE